MSKVRTFETADVDDVANLFQRLLRKTSDPANDDLKAYFQHLFIEQAPEHPNYRSRVHLRDDGSISGFIGVLPVRMEFEGRQLNAVDCGSFVCDDRDSDPFAGARLLRDVLSGPQDLSFTETANDVATEMWRSMRATVLGSYSLGWLRVLRPVRFTVAAASKRATPLKIFKPVAGLIDSALFRNVGEGSWLHHTEKPSKADAFLSTDITNAEFAAQLPLFLRHFPLRPVWSKGELEEMLQHSARKLNYGERVQQAVQHRSGKIIGLYLYYGGKGEIGRTVQIVSEPGQESIVIDCLLRDAFRRGLVAVRGATQPNLLQAMIGKKCAFVASSATIVHTRDPLLLDAMKSGHAFINGLAGEGWTRFIGDRFE